MNEKWLIRLKDCKNDHMIACYFCRSPKQQLETFYFMKENNIPLGIPKDFDNENYKYNDEEAGSISSIEICFGNEYTYCYIDVWLEDIH